MRKKTARQEEIESVRKHARTFGYDVVWSPVNQAFFISEAEGEQPKVLAVKNTLEEVREFMRDDWRFNEATSGRR